MEAYEIGTIMRDARHRHGLTQEELAFGVCSVSTLSKIETGSRIPHISTFEALMQKMGEPKGPYVFYLSADTLEQRTIIRELEGAIRMQNKERVRKLIEQLKDVRTKEHILDAQWVALAKAVLEFWDGKDAGEVYLQLHDVMRMTRPNAGEIWLGEERYTYCELLIFQLLAACLQKKGEFAHARRLLLELLHYHQKNLTDVEWIQEQLAVLYYRLAALHFEMGMYTSSANYCEKGIQTCFLHEKYHLIQKLLIQGAQIMAKLGDTSESYLAAYHAGLLDKIRTNQSCLSKFQL